MQDVIAMVLAGGRVEELSVLTLERPKAAVPFGGQYRIIDFVLSCLRQADIERIGVLSLYRPSSLIDHIGIGEPWDFIGRGRGIKILPPYLAGQDSHWYRGTSDAIYQNLNFVRDHAPREVLVLSGDHVYNVDFRALIEQHRQTGADMTMAVREMEPELGRGRFGFAEVDSAGRVVGYQEKPDEPRSRLVSLTAYLFNTDVLIARIEENIRTGQALQIYSEILPVMIERDHVHAFRYDGYWSYARSVDSYHQANMDMTGDKPALELRNWQVRTRRHLQGLGDPPPLHIALGARVESSVISGGVRIAGTVQRSVLSPGVIVEEGAVVRDSVILNDAIVRRGARLDRTVIDKKAEIGSLAVVGDGPVTEPNRLHPEALQSGVTVIGRRAQVPAGAWIGRNCVVYPQMSASDWSTKTLASGETLSNLGGTL